MAEGAEGAVAAAAAVAAVVAAVVFQQRLQQVAAPAVAGSGALHPSADPALRPSIGISISACHERIEVNLQSLSVSF